VLLSDRMPNKHVNAGRSKVVWVQTAFGPAIHHISPRSTFSIPWFPLRDRLRKLSPEQVASSQWTVAVDLDTICDLGAPAIFGATAKLNRPPTLGSAHSVLWDGVLHLASNNNTSQRMIRRGSLMLPC
jgi:hypothetical protein